MCRNPHRANVHHSRDEVSKDVNKMKAKQPTDFLTTENRSFIVGMLEEGVGQEISGGDSRDEGLDKGTGLDADWIEDPDNHADSFMESFGLTYDLDLTNVECSFSKIVLLHDLTVTDDNQLMMSTITEGLNKAAIILKGVRIDSGESTSSIMSLYQYGAYSSLIWTSYLCVPDGKSSVRPEIVWTKAYT